MTTMYQDGLLKVAQGITTVAELRRVVPPDDLEEPADGEPAIALPPALSTEMAGSRPQRILVVDDDAALRDVLCDLLRAEHFDVDLASDGEEALGCAPICCVRAPEHGRIIGAASRGDVMPDERRDGPLTVLATRENVAGLPAGPASLAAVQREYRQLFDNGGVAIYPTPPHGRFIAANHTLARMLGYESPDELMSSVTDIAPQLYVDANLRAGFQRQLEANGLVSRFEAEFWRRDGTRIWMSVSAQAIRDEAGRLLYYEGFDEDITERKAAERQFRAIFEHALEGMAIFDDDRRFVEVNPAVCALVGLSREEFLTRTFGAQTAPGLDPERAWRETRGAGHSRGEWRIARADGAEREVEYTAVADFLPGRHLAVFRDITDRKHSEAALRESEERYRAFFDRSPLPMWVYGWPDLRFLAVNDAAVRKYGYTRDEFLAMTIRDIRPPEDVPALLEYVAKRIDGFNDDRTWRHRLKDGRIIDVRVAGHPVSVGAEQATLVVISDVTDRVRAERHTAGFLRLGRALSEAATVEEAARSIVGCADELWTWHACTLDVYSRETDRLEPVLNVDTIRGERQDVRPARIGLPLSASQRRVIEEGALLILRPPGGPLPPDSVPFGDLGRASASVMAVPIRHAGEVTGVLTIQSYAERAYEQADLDLLQAIADHAAGALDRIRLRAEVTERLLVAQDEERRRIARELHDETGQSLTSLLIGLRGVAGAKTLSAARAMARPLRRVVSRVLEDLSRLAHGLHPTALDDLGLVPALERLVADHGALHGQQATLQAGGLEGRRLSRSVETALYRIAQESLTNVARHSGASRVEVGLVMVDSSVCLSVRDDGRGFDLSALRTRAGAGSHLGLASLRERAEMLGGSLAVTSGPGVGTTMTIRIPV